MQYGRITLPSISCRLPVIQTAEAPSALALSMAHNPIGPAPVTRTLWPRVIPALRQPCRPTERGSTHAPSSKLTLSGNLIQKRVNYLGMNLTFYFDGLKYKYICYHQIAIRKLRSELVLWGYLIIIWPTNLIILSFENSFIKFYRVKFEQIYKPTCQLQNTSMSS